MDRKAFLSRCKLCSVFCLLSIFITSVVLIAVYYDTYSYPNDVCLTIFNNFIYLLLCFNLLNYFNSTLLFLTLDRQVILTYILY